MSKIPIEHAERYRKRIYTSFGNDLCKYLAELITNADDSYKRLEAHNKNIEQGLIDVSIYKNKMRKEVWVVDQAEGMNKQDLQDSFAQYGSSTSGFSSSENVRGLFGQGATQVLMNAAIDKKPAEVYSFKQGKFHQCRFYWDKDQEYLDIKEVNINEELPRTLRNDYGIKNNGTIIRFGLPNHVKLPRNLSKRLRNFYMLRFIFANSARKVRLYQPHHKYLSKYPTIEHIRYEFPHTGTLIHQKQFSFKYKNKNIVGCLKLYGKSSSKGEDLKILVFDEHKTVYDNTFFGHARHTNSNFLHGTLELREASGIIRAKLDQNIPEDIITETREGFNKKHPFYIALTKCVEPILKKALDDIDSQDIDEAVNLSNNKDWNNALRQLNRYFREELETVEDPGGRTGHDPPPEGLRFVRPSIKLTKNIKYSIKLLINTDRIPLNSEVKIASDNINIQFSPQFIKVAPANSNLVIKHITISGNVSNVKAVISASFSNMQTNLFVTVVDEIIHYPKDGLEFWPTRIKIRSNARRKAKLFVDLEKYKIGTIIHYKTDSSLIKLIKRDTSINDSDKVTDDVACLTVGFSSGDFLGECHLVASIGTTKSKLAVKVTDHTKPPFGGFGGFLNDIVARSRPDDFWQVAYDASRYQIMINREHSINKIHFGSLKNLEWSKLNKRKKSYCAELVAGAAARHIIEQKVDKGHLLTNNHEVLIDEIQKQKNKIMNIFIHALRL